MRAVVTGAAGFIGSHLCEALLSEGHDVTGIDSFTSYYDPEIKRQNWSRLLEFASFTGVTKDLQDPGLSHILDHANVIYHLAGQPGVRGSFGPGFRDYVENNVAATANLLESARAAEVEKVVYASSSSVYGRVPLPMTEDGPTHPYSPYGVTKHAAEQLVRVAYENFGLWTVSLRFFTVYGPRQRPDMAFSRFIHNILNGRELVVYGDGTQTRDFTYVGDVIRALQIAAEKAPAGSVYNVGGGHREPLRRTIETMEEVIGRKARIRFVPAIPGDVPDTAAEIRKIQSELGWTPATTLNQGIHEQVNALVIGR